MLTEPFIAAGAGIVPGEYGDIQMIDLAPTVAALLGTNIPASAQGRILTDMLELTPEQIQQMENVQSYQQVALANAYTEAIGKPILLEPLETDVDSAQAAMAAAKSSRLTSERIPRFIFVLVLFACIGVLLWLNWNRNFLWMAIGAVVYALLFHFRYAVIADLTYSLSSVSSADDLINTTAVTALISLAIPWWVLFTYLGVFKMEPRRAAEIAFELIFAVLILLALPIGWNYALNGPLVGWTLPDMGSMFLGFLSILQALIIAAAGIILSAATAWITWSQQRVNPRPVSKRK